LSHISIYVSIIFITKQELCITMMGFPDMLHEYPVVPSMTLVHRK
jgi:hypothetical protein